MSGGTSKSLRLFSVLSFQGFEILFSWCAWVHGSSWATSDKYQLAIYRYCQVVSGKHLALCSEDTKYGQTWRSFNLRKTFHKQTVPISIEWSTNKSFIIAISILRKSFECSQQNSFKCWPLRLWRHLRNIKSNFQECQGSDV